MSWRIVEQTPSFLSEHARIPISFRVDSRLEVTPADSGLGGFSIVERAVETPYVKDYDPIPGEHPLSWAERRDLTRWGLLAAFHGDMRIGGAVLAWDAPGLDMLEGRTDLAVLWDIRIHPEHRRKGVGNALFGASELWAKERSCQWLKIETQNINVAACRFYARQGCVLRSCNPFAYPALPAEAQLLWYKDLNGPAEEFQAGDGPDSRDR